MRRGGKNKEIQDTLLGKIGESRDRVLPKQNSMDITGHDLSYKIRNEDNLGATESSKVGGRGRACRHQVPKTQSLTLY